MSPFLVESFAAQALTQSIPAEECCSHLLVKSVTSKWLDAAKDAIAKRAEGLMLTCCKLRLPDRKRISPFVQARFVGGARRTSQSHRRSSKKTACHVLSRFLSDALGLQRPCLRPPFIEGRASVKLTPALAVAIPVLTMLQCCI